VSGFPDSAAGTIIPNAFFSEVLPGTSDAAELIVSTYVFYALGLHRRRPRFVTLRELEADAGLTRTLANVCISDDRSPLARESGRGEGGEGALARGLDLAVQRGTLIRASSGGEMLYTINTPANRRGLERLAAEGVRVESPLPPAEREGPPNIYTLYEENIGGITPLIADDLREAEERFPAPWIEDAIREAAELNKRSWRYVRTILRRWETEGRDEEHRRDPEADWLARRYRAGKRPRSGTPR
jgi:DnaD/phage-associated family protein